MNLSLKSIIQLITTKKYEITDENGKIDEEKSMNIAKYAILSSCEI